MCLTLYCCRYGDASDPGNIKLLDAKWKRKPAWPPRRWNKQQGRYPLCYPNCETQDDVAPTPQYYKSSHLQTPQYYSLFNPPGGHATGITGQQSAPGPTTQGSPLAVASSENTPLPVSHKDDSATSVLSPTDADKLVQLESRLARITAMCNGRLISSDTAERLSDEARREYMNGL